MRGWKADRQSMSGSAQEDLFRQVILDNPLPMVWCSLPGWEVQCYSRRFTATFGYTIEDIPTLEAWFAVAYPDEDYRALVRSQWAGFLDDWARNGTPVPDKEVYVVARDGSRHEVVVSTQLLPGQALVSFIDLTKMHRTETLLADTEQRYRRLFDNMTSAFALHELLHDPAGRPVGWRILEVNPAYTRHTGLEASQVVGKTMQELQADFDPEWLRKIDEVVRTGEPLSYTRYFPRLERWFETHLFCPAPGQFATLFNDVTERVKAREALARLNAELEQRIQDRTHELEQSTRQLMESEKLAALGALVAGIAHEVNTPLGTAYTAASYLMEVIRQDLTGPHPLSSNIVEGMEMIMRNLGKASGIIQSFRQFSADQISGMARDFLLHELVNDVLTSLHPRVRKSGAVVSCDVPAGVMLSGPAGDLSQVLTNLVMNAVIHGIGPDHPAIRIQVRAVLQPEQLELEVGNDGQPIPDEVRQRVFDPFFTTRRSSGGTGLGLSIVHSIVVQRCNGSIVCEPGPSGGVVFRMTFPLGPDQPIKLRMPPKTAAV